MTHSSSPIKNKIFLIIFLVFSTEAFAQAKWELQKDKCGVKVWTQNIPNSSIDKYKVQGVIEANPNDIVKALMDFSTFHKWHDGVKRAKTLKHINKNKVVAYMELDFPWPTKNRDSYAYSEVVSEKDQTRVTIKQLKKQFKTKNVRVAKSEGFWLVQPTSVGALVTQELHAEPGGSLPDWIVNSMIAKGPYKTLKGLRAFLGAKECY